ncbi:MmgE/PrpD family protein [Baekduia soli]|uniref:MmgE/PrpD family protein n=1 Tax=Baekduia soli TaxID=496014 RepID=A0A5B8U4Q8_9ACTN|nr:MmgE/PrpD family protein [Baekduia soli]QEC48106.1 MmgE/PrpD family protein [Baekduia soli]
MSTVHQSTTSVGRQLGRFVAELADADVPAEVAEKLRTSLLHNLSCALGASTQGAALWELARGRGPAEATMLCDGDRVLAEDAAFANGALMHTRAQDDTFFAGKTHIGSAVFPAALAIAEREGSDGAAFLRAITAGCEVGCAVSERLAAVSTARGFRATPVFSPLGAAAASASLLGLDAEGISNAIAIAANFAGGLNQTWIDGTSEYRLHLGMAARHGVHAARLAQAGFTGAPHWYEGAAGFANAFAGPDADLDIAGDWELGTRWRSLDVTYKPYPVCAITQSPVQVAIDLANRHDIDPAQIVAVRVHLNPADRSYPGTVNEGPFVDVGATLMSAQYCVAMALKHRSATLEGLREFDDEVIARLVSVTEVLPDEGLPSLAGRVEVDLDAGTVGGELVPDVYTYGWDWNGVVANIKRMEPEIALDRAQLDALEQAVHGLADLDSVSPIVRGTVA